MGLVAFRVSAQGSSKNRRTSAIVQPFKTIRLLGRLDANDRKLEWINTRARPVEA